MKNGEFNGMRFEEVINELKVRNIEFEATIPSEDEFGFIVIGNRWSDTFEISFDDNDIVEWSEWAEMED